MAEYTPAYMRTGPQFDSNAADEEFHDMQSAALKHAPEHQKNYISHFNPDKLMEKNMELVNKKTQDHYRQLKKAYQEADLTNIEQLHDRVTEITTEYYRRMEEFLKDRPVPSKVERFFIRKKKRLDKLLANPIKRKPRNWGNDQVALESFTGIYKIYFKAMNLSYLKPDLDQQKAARKEAYDTKVDGLKAFFKKYPLLDIRPSAEDRKKAREDRVTARVDARKAQKEAKVESKQTRGSQNSSAAGASQGARARVARKKYGAASKP